MSRLLLSYFFLTSISAFSQIEIERNEFDQFTNSIIIESAITYDDSNWGLGHFTKKDNSTNNEYGIFYSIQYLKNKSEKETFFLKVKVQSEHKLCVSENSESIILLGDEERIFLKPSNVDCGKLNYLSYELSPSDLEKLKNTRLEGMRIYTKSGHIDFLAGDSYYARAIISHHIKEVERTAEKWLMNYHKEFFYITNK